MIKKIVLLFLIAIAFSFCGGREEKHSPAEPAPFISLDICLKRPYFSSFFPYHLQYVNDSHIYDLIYNTLISANYSGRLESEIAKHWKISADMKEYTFILRNDVKFHNGRPLTADDIIFTFKQLIKHARSRQAELSYIEGTDDFIAGKTGEIPGLIKTGRFKFKIKLRQKFKYFLHFLSSKVTSIIPVDYGGLSKEEFREHPIGSGPFKLQHRQAETNRFKFIKNKDYFAKTGNVDQLNLCLPDKSVDLETLLRYDLFVRDLSPGQKSLFADRKIVNTSHDLETFLAIDPGENRWVRDRLNRQLINYSINREQLVDFLASGNCMPAHTIIPINLFGHNPYYRLSYLETGKTGRPLKEKSVTFTLLIHHGHKELAEYLQKQLEKINVHLEIIEIDAGLYSEKIRKPHKHSIIITGSSDYPTPFNFLTQLYRKDGLFNYHKINSPRIGERISRLPLMDIKQEADTLKGINKLIEEESIYIPLYYYSNYIVMKDKIKKVLFKYPSIINFSSIEIETGKKVKK